MINVKNNIWIEGFDDFIKYWNSYTELGQITDSIITIIYSGKTSEIFHYVDYVEKLSIFTPQYRNYKGIHSDYFETAKESFESACDKEYCIIYKKK